MELTMVMNFIPPVCCEHFETGHHFDLSQLIVVEANDEYELPNIAFDLDGKYVGRCKIDREERKVLIDTTAAIFDFTTERNRRLYLCDLRIDFGLHGRPDHFKIQLANNQGIMISK
jgi:hypothetical protein